MIKRNNRKTAAPQTRWRAYVLIFTCALLMISGFFFAGRQHFSWMDYGMKNSRLRKQIDDLQAEKRRLLLAREVQLSPAEIKKAAKKAGLGDDAAVASVTLVSAKEIKPAASAPASPWLQPRHSTKRRSQRRASASHQPTSPPRSTPTATRRILSSAA